MVVVAPTSVADGVVYPRRRRSRDRSNRRFRSCQYLACLLFTGKPSSPVSYASASSVMAAMSPFLAALAIHFLAVAGFFRTPSPPQYIMPILYCASASPAAAALRYQYTAPTESASPTLPVVLAGQRKHRH